MALVMGYIKDLDIAVPLGKEIRFRSADGTAFEGWEILVRGLTLDQWDTLYADVGHHGIVVKDAAAET